MNIEQRLLDVQDALDREGWAEIEVFYKRGRSRTMQFTAYGDTTSLRQEEGWAVRAGDPAMANGNALDAHYGCVLGHLMNNSYRIGQEVPFNEQAGGFADNSDASEHFLRLHETMAKGVGVSDDAKYTVGPWLTYDPQTERHTGSHADAANALLKDPNRKGFEIPEAAKV